MKVYNAFKTEELKVFDLTKGYLKDDVLVVQTPAIAEVKEVSHYEIIKVYPNGGKDVRKVVDIPAVKGQEAKTITEAIKVFVPFTEKELINNMLNTRIAELKAKLFETDYKAIKFFEGEMSEAEYSSTRIERKIWREEINRLQSQIR